jgi:deoxycytidine triphosphate deaminase
MGPSRKSAEQIDPRGIDLRIQDKKKVLMEDENCIVDVKAGRDWGLLCE